jgi:hypothetical protein
LAGSNPLLEQVPLTVSPFISLPSATTLSYNYKTMPSSIPPSSLGIQAASDDSALSAGAGAAGGGGGATPQQGSSANKPRYIVSGSGGHAAHPDDIITTCRALHAQVSKMQEDAERELRGFEERIRARDLAEKRRLAPGWLDSEAKLLEPERSASAAAGEPPDVMDAPVEEAAAAARQTVDEGAQLDRAFGGMALR